MSMPGGDYVMVVLGKLSFGEGCDVGACCVVNDYFPDVVPGRILPVVDAGCVGLRRFGLVALEDVVAVLAVYVRIVVEPTDIDEESYANGSD